LASKFQAKISDFGLSRFVHKSLLGVFLIFGENEDIERMEIVW